MFRVSVRKHSVCLDYRQLAQCFAPFIPHDAHIPIGVIMDRAHGSVPSNVRDVIDVIQPAAFFLRCADDYEVTQRDDFPFPFAFENTFVRRRVALPTEGPKSMYPEFAIAPKMILSLAMAIPSNFVPLPVIQKQLIRPEFIPGMSLTAWPLHVLLTMFPRLFDVQAHDSEPLRVRGLMSTFEGCDAPHESVTEVLSKMHKMLQNTTPMSTLERLLTDADRSLLDVVFGGLAPALGRHKMYFNVTTDGVRSINVRAPIVAWKSRVPAAESLRQLVMAAAKYTDIAAHPEGFVPKQSRSSKIKKRTKEKVARVVPTPEEIEEVAQLLHSRLPEDPQQFMSLENVLKGISEEEWAVIKGHKKTSIKFLKAFPLLFRNKEVDGVAGAWVFSRVDTNAPAQDTENPYMDLDYLLEAVKKILDKEAPNGALVDCRKIASRLPEIGHNAVKKLYGGFILFVQSQPSHFVHAEMQSVFLSTDNFMRRKPD